MLWFVRLKKEHEPEDDTFLGILRDPDAVDAQGKLVVAGVMEWAEADLGGARRVRSHGDDLGDLANLRRVTAALDLVATTLQPASDLVAWTVPNPDGALVRGVRETLKGRMDLAAWRESMQSVSDAVRNARRDALVAYILHHDTPSPEIETADQLYEYFLVDVQMDACMQTSRIRLALSTVQLFVQRCLLNLEPSVSPSSINADHWTWMRRYRVWEANRKVFLYPENWLEPELRDGKSPFFRDLESRAAQGRHHAGPRGDRVPALPAEARRRRAPGDRGRVPRGGDAGDDRRRHPARHRAHARQHPRALVPPVRVRVLDAVGEDRRSTSRATSSSRSCGRSGCSSSG